MTTESTSTFGVADADRIAREAHEGQVDKACLLYTSDAADDLLCVDLGGRRIIKKNNKLTDSCTDETTTHIAWTQ